MAESFLALTRLTASIRCGHSYPNFWNQTEAVASALFEGQDKLPAEFRWIDRRMIVTVDHTPGRALARGTEILSINGVRAAQVLDSLMPLARADGANDAKRVAYLEVNGRDRYHAFDVLFPLVFPQRDTMFTLKVLTPGARASHTVPLVAGFPESDEPNVGVEPDIMVPLTRQSITKGVDVALEAVRSRVRTLRRRRN